jgi:hypothetical protein
MGSWKRVDLSRPERTYLINNGLEIIIQWKPLYVITLGQIKTDNINRMITISE